jgi:hypothetical protein
LDWCFSKKGKGINGNEIKYLFLFCFAYLDFQHYKPHILQSQECELDRREIIKLMLTMKKGIKCTGWLHLLMNFKELKMALKKKNFENNSTPFPVTS